MMQPNVWDLIESGKLEEACARADAEFQESGDVFPLRNKIFALLQLGKHDEAVRLSNQIIKKEGDSESEFIFLGVALWLKGEREHAVKVWKSGLNAKYTDAAGGVQIPMLLLFAAVRALDKKLEGEALNLLKKASKSKRTINWPGPIAQYLLDLISEEELMSRVETQPILHEKQSCQADFYVGLKRLVSGDADGFRKKLETCIGYGLVCSVKAEPYLAKGELKALQPN